MTLEWDAGAYEVVSAPQTSWGATFLGLFLERRGLRGDEAVLDAGCGTGKVTEMLLGHLPEGRILAVDGSEAMVEAARRRFAGEPRVRVERQDLLSLEVEEPVDVIFSTATFHWIKDHDRLFRRLAAALKPGGQLAAQCGGEGNISRATKAVEEVMREERYREYFEDFSDDKYYADPASTRERLLAAGFEEIEVWMHDERTSFGSVEELARFLGTVVLGGHMKRLPEREQEPFVLAVAEKVAVYEEPPVMDYVRLNILARRAA